MVFGSLLRLIGGGHSVEHSERAHLTLPSAPAALYAVGDIHGCRAELAQLHRQIEADGANFPGEKIIVYLGDLIDRGPDSAGVLDVLLSAAPAGFRRISLVGNHETMLLDFLDNPRSRTDWIEFGGDRTLQSYGINSATLLRLSPSKMRSVLDSHIPQEHIEFIRELPLSLSMPGVVLVHAGIRWSVPMEQQDERDLLWIRDEFFKAEPTPDLLVIHGHTPAAEPVILPNRICVDTGAFATGRLTAVRLAPGHEPEIISTL